VKLYYDGTLYYVVSEEKPDRFPNVFIAQRGASPDSLKECGVSVEQLKRFTRVENVPVEWQGVLGLQAPEPQPAETPRKRKTRAKTRTKTKVRVETRTEVVEDFRRLDQMASVIGALAFALIGTMSIIISWFWVYVF
jgi:hypothetical protein